MSGGNRLGDDELKRLLGIILATSGTTLFCAFVFGNWVVVRVLKGVPGAPLIDANGLSASAPWALLVFVGVLLILWGRRYQTGTGRKR